MGSAADPTPPSTPPFLPYCLTACRYAVSVRYSELMEAVEADDWNQAVEGEEQAVPSWVRAAFALADEYKELNQRELSVRSVCVRVWAGGGDCCEAIAEAALLQPWLWGFVSRWCMPGMPAACMRGRVGGGRCLEPSAAAVAATCARLTTRNPKPCARLNLCLSACSRACPPAACLAAGAAEEDELLSEAEMRGFEDSVQKYVQMQGAWAGGRAGRQAGLACVHSMLFALLCLPQPAPLLLPCGKSCWLAGCSRPCSCH